MTHLQKALSSFAVIVQRVFACAIIFCCSAECDAQENRQVKEAFTDSGSFPWYDGENDEIQSVDVSAGGRAASLHRDEIPEADQVNNPVNNNAVSEETNSAFSLWVFRGIILIGVLAIVCLLVWAIMRFSGNNANIEKEVEEKLEFTPERIEALPFDLQNSASQGDLLSMARQAYNANDFRNAAIYLYSHVLLSLDHFGWIRLTRGKTNRQYLRELNDAQKMSRFFEPLMIGFERAFFGNYDLSRGEIDPSWNLIDSFQQDVKLIPKR